MISNFNREKAEKYILENDFAYAQLLYRREIVKDINDSEFLGLQEKLLAEKLLAKLMSKQLENSAWQPPEKDEVFTPMQKSTLWTLILLGDVGLNGSVIPGIQKAVEYIFETQFDKEKNYFHNDHPIWGDFMQSHNAITLRALLRLGFANNEMVKKASMKHLELIHGKEGICKYKKGGFKCPWGLTKNLRFFNEWPNNWKNQQFEESVKACQEYLLEHDITTAAYPREGKGPNNKWFLLSYFKTYYCDYFEIVEALVDSGIKNHDNIKRALNKIGSLCHEEKTWICNLDRSWLVKFEMKEQPSPWLSFRGIKIANRLK